MAGKTVNELDAASVPLVGTDKILVSRDGINLNKAIISDLPVQPTLVSGTNIKTINGSSILGSGDITVASSVNLGTTQDTTTVTVTNSSGTSAIISSATTSNAGVISAADKTKLDAFVPVSYSTISDIALTTSATPTAGTPVTFASAACTGMIVKAGVTRIEYQRNGTGSYHVIRPFETKYIYGITDANQIGFRRSDYASARTTQTTTVRASLINTSATIVSQNLSMTVSNASYTAFSSVACSAIEVTNTCGKDVYLKKDAGAVQITLRKNESLLITGITNANQVSVQTWDSEQPFTPLVAETFNVYPAFTRRVYNIANLIDPGAKMYLGEQMSWDVSFSLPQLNPFTKYKPVGKTITQFNTAANTTLSGAGGGTVTDTSLASDETFGTWSSTTQFGARTAPTNTFTATGVNSYTSSVNTIAPIDVTNSSIHVVVKRIGTGGSVTSMSVDLFSTGSPSSPGADYHTLNMVNDLSGGFAKVNGYGARSFGINTFSVVGAGANLSAITFARIRVNGTSGLVIRPEEIKSVPNKKTKATCIFSFDDWHSSPVTAALKALASYGYPAVLFPSPAEQVVGQNSQTNGCISVDNALILQHRYGWQIATQEYLQERTTDLSVADWLDYQQRNFILGAALGFDADGLRDGSYYGGGPYYITSEQYKAAQRIHASLSDASNGVGVLGDGVAPFYFADTNPPGDPWVMRRLNVNCYGTTAGTASQIFDKFKLYVDQAIANKGICHFYAHADWNNAEIYSAMLLLLAYLKTNEANIEVKTLVQNRQEINRLY